MLEQCVQDPRLFETFFLVSSDLSIWLSFLEHGMHMFEC